MAKEFYRDLPAHKSWVGVIWRFVWDDEVGVRCRVKRRRREGNKKGVVGGGGGWWREEEVVS